LQNETRWIIGVAGVIAHATGDILLIKTEQAGWELPGGRVEQGENLIAALQREVQEETACTVTVRRLISLSTGSSGLVIFTFLCTHAGGKPQAGDDSVDAGWFAPHEALDLVTHSAEHARLADGLAAQPGVIYRVYCASANGPVPQNPVTV
jgi:8-oxo-dGTP diphosphatase